LFQALDNKKECVGVFFEGQILDYFPKEISKTWSFAPYFEDREIEYANLFCGGKTLDEVCPEHLKDSWNYISSRMRACLVSFQEAKVDLNDVCFYDLVPKRFLFDYYNLKNRITEHVFANYEKPSNHKFLLDLTKLVNEINTHELNINAKSISSGMVKYKTREFIKNLSKKESYIEYNIFGTKTGRLTTTKTSFPILTLDKDHRSILQPNNDAFVEIDYNAAELRVFLGLLGIEQPKGDIHTWIGKNVFNGKYSRDMVKKKVFAWLYNPEAKNGDLEKIFKKQQILDKYYSNSLVKTYFGREIPSDDHHALNYIIQSTTSDLFLRQLIEIHNMLKEKNSYIAFCVHDSFIIDTTKAEKDLVSDMVRKFSDTPLGFFKVNVSIGKNFGNMNKI